MWDIISDPLQKYKFYLHFISKIRCRQMHSGEVELSSDVRNTGFLNEQNVGYNMQYFQLKSLYSL